MPTADNPLSCDEPQTDSAPAYTATGVRLMSPSFFADGTKFIEPLKCDKCGDHTYAIHRTPHPYSARRNPDIPVSQVRSSNAAIAKSPMMLTAIEWDDRLGSDQVEESTHERATDDLLTGCI